MIRVISYNICLGGKRRVEQLGRVLASRHPDIVGLVEASDDRVVEVLAAHLGMDYRLSGYGKGGERQQSAVLSRLPIRATSVYKTAVLTKQPLLEVTVEEPDGQLFTVYVAHLTAAFSQTWRANRQRRREVQEFLRQMTAQRGTRHLLMGDFNSIFPGERVKGSLLLRHMTGQRPDGQPPLDESLQPPDLDFVLPRPLRFLKPALKAASRNTALCFLLDHLDPLYVPRAGLGALTRAGYVDCFRAQHPQQPGFSWPALLPAGRIDYIFASPELASSLCACEVITEGGGISASQASDHLPVFATFGGAESLQGDAQFAGG
jgi:endonuclease/exonuclease/phosphatase family metal-dependent hydrolase